MFWVPRRRQGLIKVFSSRQMGEGAASSGFKNAFFSIRYNGGCRLCCRSKRQLGHQTLTSRAPSNTQTPVLRQHSVMTTLVVGRQSENTDRDGDRFQGCGTQRIREGSRAHSAADTEPVTPDLTARH